MTTTCQSDPRIIKVDEGNLEAAVKETASVLRQGQLVIIPTDTVYGVAADPNVPGAEERIFRAKERDRNKDQIGSKRLLWFSSLL